MAKKPAKTKIVDQSPVVTEGNTEVAPLNAPTEAIEPVVELTNTEVALTAEVALNEPTEPLNTITETPVSGVPEEASEGYIEHYVMNGVNQPIPATKVRLSDVYLHEITNDILYASYLGGELCDSGINLRFLPFSVFMLIPTDKMSDWESKSLMAEYTEGEHQTIDLVAPDHYVFIKELVKIGKGGAFVPKDKCVRNSPFLVQLKSKSPLGANANVRNTTENKPFYSNEQLKEMSSAQLKIIAQWYEPEFRGNKNDLYLFITKQQKIKQGSSEEAPQ